MTFVAREKCDGVTMVVRHTFHACEVPSTWSYMVRSMRSSGVSTGGWFLDAHKETRHRQAVVLSEMFDVGHRYTC